MLLLQLLRNLATEEAKLHLQLISFAETEHNQLLQVPHALMEIFFYQAAPMKTPAMEI
jgi:hypothetical protein